MDDSLLNKRKKKAALGLGVEKSSLLSEPSFVALVPSLLLLIPESELLNSGSLSVLLV